MTTPPPATDPTPTPASPTAPAPTAGGRHRLRGWATFVLPLAVIAALVAVTAASEEPARPPADAATAFTLPDTAGGALSLDEALAGGPALLYFSMGVGCYGCFAQIPEIADALDARGIRLVPVMVDSAELVARAAAGTGVEAPILIDRDRQVSAAYGMLGVYGHDDRPSHSFALVAQDRTIRAVRHYAEMFVPAERLLADLDL